MPTRIAQLTDLHLTASPGARAWGSDVWSNFHRTLATVRADLPPIDRLVLTGDLANQRKPATYRLLREALPDFLDRLLLVPGNHDSRKLLRAAFSDRLQPGAPGANFVDRIDGCRLLGLDTLRRFRVHGKLGAPQLSWLVRELRSAAEPTLLFMHHPPIKVGTWWLDKDLLRDLRAFESIASAAAVRGIFCGHVHQEHTGQFAGAPVWTTPATAYQFKPRARMPGPSSRTPAFRLIELQDGAVTTSVVRCRD